MSDVYLVVDSWEKLTNGKEVPVCRPNNYSNHTATDTNLSHESDIDHKYIHVDIPNNILVTADELKKCWSSLKENQRLDYMQEEESESLGDDLTSFLFHRIKFLSCKRNKKKSKACCCGVYTFKKENSIKEFKSELAYASDHHGIAFLSLDKFKFKSYYFNFKTKEVTFAKIDFLMKPFEKCGVKLFKGSLWLIKYSGAYPNEIHLIYFKTCMTKESSWYYVISKSLVTNIKMNSIFVSRNICVISNQSLLILDESTLKVGCTNRKDFVFFKDAFSQPHIQADVIDLTELQTYGIVGNRIIMVGLKLKHQNDIPNIYILSILTDGSLQLLTTLNLFTLFDKCENMIPYGFELTLHPYAKRAIIKSGASYVIIIDLVKVCVTQVLSYIDCFWSCELSIQISSSNNEVRLLGKKHESFGSTVEYLCLKYNLTHGLTLKDLALQHILKYQDLHSLQLFNLPKQLYNQLAINLT